MSFNLDSFSRAIVNVLEQFCDGGMSESERNVIHGNVTEVCTSFGLSTTSAAKKRSKSPKNTTTTTTTASGNAEKPVKKKTHVKNAYHFYVKCTMTNAVENVENPRDRMKYIATQWASLSTEGKQPFVDLAAQYNARYAELVANDSTVVNDPLFDDSVMHHVLENTAYSDVLSKPTKASRRKATTETASADASAPPAPAPSPVVAPVQVPAPAPAPVPVAPVQVQAAPAKRAVSARK